MTVELRFCFSGSAVEGRVWVGLCEAELFEEGLKVGEEMGEATRGGTTPVTEAAMSPFARAEDWSC